MPPFVVASFASTRRAFTRPIVTRPWDPIADLAGTPILKPSGRLLIAAAARAQLLRLPHSSDSEVLYTLRATGAVVRVEVLSTYTTGDPTGDTVTVDDFQIAPTAPPGPTGALSGGTGKVKVSGSVQIFVSAAEAAAEIHWARVENVGDQPPPPRSSRQILTEGGAGAPGPWLILGQGDPARPWLQTLSTVQAVGAVAAPMDGRLVDYAGGITGHLAIPVGAGAPFLLPPTHIFEARNPGGGTAIHVLFMQWGGMR